MTPDWIKWQNKRKSCPQVPFGPAFALLSGVKLSEGVFFEDPPKCGQPPPGVFPGQNEGTVHKNPFTNMNGTIQEIIWTNQSINWFVLS